MVQVIRPLDVRAQLDGALSAPRFPITTCLDRSQAPPAYPAASSAPQPACAPDYTPQPSPTERVISRTDSRITQAASGAGSTIDRRPLPESYVNKSSRLVLDLGRRVWPSRVPVYGANETISGKVLVKKADHALNISVTLEGICQTTIIERGMPVAQFSTTLVHQSQTLWAQESGEAPLATYDFSFPLPTYSQGSTEALPPSSYHAFMTRGYAEVKYCIRVDMTRSRFHRHDLVLTSIYYLPASHPPRPVNLFASELGLESETDDDYWKSIELSPWTPPGKRRSSCAKSSGLVSAEFALLKSQAYTASTPIPFRLTLRASSPALALLPHATVQLVKRWTLIASEVNVRVSRESILGTGEIWRVEEGEEGTECARIVTGCVTGVASVFKVEYLIRVCIKPPEDIRSLGSTLPSFFHQEIIRMTTHEYTDNEMIRAQPALGLTPRLAW
ncbi:arrestin [Ceratobasidium sp. AG-Ba]|nr:arrestin [Ceratobasidium sp. AG-Ba]QRW08364.1 arrestin [Ceratobasidium sp. AG-Ba]